jgi:hypothetical protein
MERETVIGLEIHAECRPDASDLPNIVMIDNADTPITDFIVM